jgi:two-component system chemotaxis response regulator CheB
MKAFIIGGSAGAIDTLKEILAGLPREQERRTFPVIVTLHLLPRGPSLLPSIFAERSPWPVKDAESTEPVENGTVYFAPSDYHLAIESDFTFSLSNEEPIMFSRPSIDLFFKSAAAVYKSELVALLLSGANADGAEGLREVLERGGRCFAQDPETAEFPEMPEAALRISPEVSAVRAEQVIEFLNGRN